MPIITLDSQIQTTRTSMDRDILSLDRNEENEVIIGNSNSETERSIRNDETISENSSFLSQRTSLISFPNVTTIDTDDERSHQISNNDISMLSDEEWWSFQPLQEQVNWLKIQLDRN